MSASKIMLSGLIMLCEMFISIQSKEVGTLITQRCTDSKTKSGKEMLHNEIRLWAIEI